MVTLKRFYFENVAEKVLLCLNANLSTLPSKIIVIFDMSNSTKYLIKEIQQWEMRSKVYVSLTLVGQTSSGLESSQFLIFRERI